MKPLVVISILTVALVACAGAPPVPTATPIPFDPPHSFPNQESFEDWRTNDGPTAYAMSLPVYKEVFEITMEIREKHNELLELALDYYDKNWFSIHCDNIATAVDESADLQNAIYKRQFDEEINIQVRGNGETFADGKPYAEYLQARYEDIFQEFNGILEILEIAETENLGKCLEAFE